MPDINNPVNIDDYQDIIDSNPHSASKDWSLHCYKGMKEHIKEHYSVLQDDICFYCKINLRFGGYGEPIEHIVPKDDKPEWMFEPKNLALSCYACNTKKNAENTLSSTSITSTSYPNNKNDFLIYHPHFDVWEENFDVFYEYFLIPKSDKGRETFRICKLYRFNLPLDKAKQKNWKEEPFKTKVIEKVLFDTNSSKEIKEQCLRISKEIIRRAKLKREITGNNTNNTSA